MGAKLQLPRSWEVWHHTPTPSANLLGAEEHHVAATKKFGVVASYPLCTYGYICHWIAPDKMADSGQAPKLHHPAG